MSEISRQHGKSASAWIEWLLLACGVFSIGTTLGIISVLAFETYTFFLEVSPAEFFGDTQWTPLFANKHFGVWPIVGGTLLTTFIALLVAGPVGIIGAVYLSEFASSTERRFLKPSIEVLAGVPTVVYGFFALTFVTPLLQSIIPGVAGFNALSPGIVIGIMILPIVTSLSDDALQAVGQNLREAAWGLGAGKAATVYRVLLPVAASGIIAAIILGISRAIGETMIVAIAAGSRPQLTLDPRQPIQTMTAYIVNVSLGDTPAQSIEYKTIFAVGATLFVMTFAMNYLSHQLARRFRMESSNR
jgi:phosphate transport system permease protein